MAYKALAMKFHPDRSGDGTEFGHRQMQLINEAFDVLSDPEKKKSYDEWRRARGYQNNDSKWEGSFQQDYRAGGADKTETQNSTPRQEEQSKSTASNKPEDSQNLSTDKKFSIAMAIPIILFVLMVIGIMHSQAVGSDAIEITKQSFGSSGAGPEQWVKADTNAEAIGWRSKKVEGDTYFVSYEYYENKDDTSSVSLYCYEVDLSDQTSKDIVASSELSKKYVDLGYITYDY